MIKKISSLFHITKQRKSPSGASTNFNSTHPLWGCSEEDVDGDELGGWLIARGLLFNVKYIKKWCSALFTSKKRVFYTRKNFSAAVLENHTTPHQLPTTLLCAIEKKRNLRWRWWRWKERKRTSSSKKCEVVVVRDVLRVYNYTFTYIPPCSPFLQLAPLCIFVCIHITTKSFIIITNGKVDRCWCNSSCCVILNNCVCC